MKKRILTIYDLENFYSRYKKSMSFSSEKAGYQIAVQVPTRFDAAQVSDDETLVFYPMECFHTKLNKNGSSVTEDAAVKAMKGMAYKPVLANFCEYVDENGETVRDFTSHDMTIDKDGNIEYQERQIGCFTNDDPWFKDVKNEDKKFICANIAIPLGYTDANEIIARKGGTDASVELIVNELAYDAKSKILELTDVDVQGITLLGTHVFDDGSYEKVNPGMEGAGIKLSDFSADKNSMFSHVDDNNKLIEVLDRLNTTLSSFNTNSKKGGVVEMDKFNELLEKYNKTADDIEFDCDGMTDDELEAKFAEMFDDDSADDTSDEGDAEGDAVEESVVEDEPEDIGEPVATSLEDDLEEIEDEDELIADEACKKRKRCSINENGNISVEFEVSHQEIVYALYELISAYEESDNEWYYISAVYDNYFIMEGNRCFKQEYAVEDDVVTLAGERQEVFKMLLTESEKVAIEQMRENYAQLSEKYEELKAFKDNFDAEAEAAEKAEIFNRAEYAEIHDTEEFKALIDSANELTVEEIGIKAELLFAKFAKTQLNFAANNVEKKSVGINFKAKEDPKKVAYAGLFDN